MALTRDEAIAQLKPLARKILRNVYDDLTDLQSSAIFVLQPDFEYPDWDYRTVAQLWKRAN